jgi:hypothetical protein
MRRGQKSNSVDGCQYADSLRLVEWHHLTVETELVRTLSSTLRRVRRQGYTWMKLCAGTVEIAFDHQDSDVVVKTDIFRKIRRGTEDIVHEPLRG